jgi:hypothetical protein
VGPGKSGAELLADLSKKGPNSFEVWFYTKTVIFLTENYNFQRYNKFYSNILHRESLKNL